MVNENMVNENMVNEILTKTDWVFRPSTDYNMTCLQGEVNVTYSDLVKIFGKPHSQGDSYKSDAEWCFAFNHPNSKCEDGFVVATIYNYKDGKNYLGQNGIDVEDITNWHVGGHNKLALKLIKAIISNNLE